MTCDRFFSRAGCFVIIAATSGCAGRLPTYSWTTPEEALAVLRTRAESVKTVEAACDITLTRADGESVTLEGALVARNPGWLRIRAWKFNSAVFDLTLTPEGLWIMQGDSAEVRDRMPINFNAAQIAHAWEMLRTDAHGRSDDVVIECPDESGGSVVFVVRTKTLVPTEVFASKTHGRDRLELGDYRLVDGIAWPYTLKMFSDSARAIITMHDVALNQESASTAFTPPVRAVKQP
jgi:hypothetical protein